MVSFHTPLSPTRRKIVPELENLLKRRKLSDDDDDDQAAAHLSLIPNHQNPIKGLGMMRSTLDTELHLETPLPLEWQRCLDIKSGQIYFFNTRTNRRMLTDPRSNPVPPHQVTPPPQPNHGHMSLDLELNLPCGSSSSSSPGKNIQIVDHNITKPNSGTTSNPSSDDDRHLMMSPTTTTAATTNNNNKVAGGLSRAPSWLSFEGDQQEMVAAACKKCHMLVMMCKSSPSCPNCKFLHPPEQSTTPSLLKRRLSLLC